MIDNIRRSRAHHADALSLLQLYQRHTTTSLRVWPAQKTVIRGRVHKHAHASIQAQACERTEQTDRYNIEASCFVRAYVGGGRVGRKPLTDFSTFSTSHGISGCTAEKKQIENLKIPTHCLSRIYFRIMLCLDDMIINFM